VPPPRMVGQMTRLGGQPNRAGPIETWGSGTPDPKLDHQRHARIEPPPPTRQSENRQIPDAKSQHALRAEMIKMETHGPAEP